MTRITVTEKDYNESNLLYVQSSSADLLSHAGCTVSLLKAEDRSALFIDCPEYYLDIVRAEIADKLAEIISINYKYVFFKKNVKVGGLSGTETEILMASLIAADLEEDKRYSFERFKCMNDVAIDGVYNFRLQPLKRKWEDIVSYMPSCFINSQLHEFVTYLLENKKKRVYIDEGRVYDSHYRRLSRCDLLGGGENVKIVREVLLSNCGEIELSGKLPEDDEKYLKEFYTDKIFFSGGYFN